MTAEPPKIDYESLAQNAMRGLVRSVLVQTAKSGLPGEHHFYISFDTCADGASLSRRLKEKYPTEMTIVLQHRFSDLVVHDDRFEVKLTFDGIPERLVVPFASIKVFFDPSVHYGLQFEDPRTVAANSDPDIDAPDADTIPIHSGHHAATDQSTNQPGKLEPAEANAESAKPARSEDGAIDDEPTILDPEQVASATEGAKILRLDAFRKKQT